MGNLLSKKKSKVDKIVDKVQEEIQEDRAQTAPADITSLNGKPASPADDVAVSSPARGRGIRDRPSTANDVENDSAVLAPMPTVSALATPPPAGSSPPPGASRRKGSGDESLTPSKPPPPVAIRSTSSNVLSPTASGGGTPNGTGTPQRTPSRSNIQPGGQGGDMPTNVPIELWYELFGKATVKYVYSRLWSEREHALKTIKSNLMNEKWRAKQSAGQVWDPVCTILQTSLRDKVAPVYFVSIDLLKALVSIYADQLDKSQVKDSMDDIVPSLVHRTGNLNPRIHESSQNAVMFLAWNKSMGPGYIAPFVLEPIRRTKNQNATIAGRLDLLGRMVDEFGLTDGEGLTTQAVMSMVIPALSVADDKVRKMAVDLSVKVYSNVGKAIQPHLVRIKPALLAILYRKFGEVDEARGDKPQMELPETAPPPGSPAAPAATANGDANGVKPLPPPRKGGAPSALPPLDRKSSGKLSPMPLSRLGTLGDNRPAPVRVALEENGISSNASTPVDSPVNTPGGGERAYYGGQPGYISSPGAASGATPTHHFNDADEALMNDIISVR